MSLEMNDYRQKYHPDENPVFGQNFSGDILRVLQKSPIPLRKEDITDFISQIGSMDHPLQVRKLMSLHDMWWLGQKTSSRMVSIDSAYFRQL